MNLQMDKIYLKDHLHFVIQRKKSLVVSITKETVNSLLLAVESYSPAGSAMTKSVTIQWTGILFFFLCIVFDQGLYII